MPEQARDIMCDFCIAPEFDRKLFLHLLDLLVEVKVMRRTNDSEVLAKAQRTLSALMNKLNQIMISYPCHFVDSTNTNGRTIDGIE